MFIGEQPGGDDGQRSVFVGEQFAVQHGPVVARAGVSAGRTGVARYRPQGSDGRWCGHGRCRRRRRHGHDDGQSKNGRSSSRWTVVRLPLRRCLLSRSAGPLHFR